MQPEQRRAPLAAADAAARRLLTQAIDIRFDLDDAREQVNGGKTPTQADLQRLREEVFSLVDEINRLEEALWPVQLDSEFSLEEETEQVIF